MCQSTPNEKKPDAPLPEEVPSFHAAPVVDAKGSHPTTFFFFVVRPLRPGFCPGRRTLLVPSYSAEPTEAFLVTGVVRADASGAFHLLGLTPLLYRLSPHLPTFGDFFIIILETWNF